MASATKANAAQGQFDIPPAPLLGSSLALNASAAGRYLDAVGQGLQKLGAPPDRKADARQHAKQLKGRAHELREAFFRRHAAEMYDKMTSGCTVPLRVVDLVYKAADLYPGLLPTRAEIDAERALNRQFAKEGKEIDQGLFIAHVLADERCGRHLVHAMLKPKREAEQRLTEFLRTGRVDLGSAHRRAPGQPRHRHAHQSQIPQRRGRCRGRRAGDRRRSRAARRRNRGRRAARRRAAAPQVQRIAASSMPAST